MGDVFSRTKARHSVLEGSSSIASANVDELSEFARELSELSYKYGLGITGNPILFLMEKEDYSLSYQVDGESNLGLV